MRRAVLALATIAACSSPAPAVRVGLTTTAAPPTTTTAATKSEGVGAAGTDHRPAPSDPTPAPSTVALPVDPPLNPPEAVDGGTTRASWYGAESGARTADGARYDPAGLTFAHRSLAFGTRVRFCRNGACVVARCSDRGPAAWTGREFDLSEGTFAALAPLAAGVAGSGPIGADSPLWFSSWYSAWPWVFTSC